MAAASSVASASNVIDLDTIRKARQPAVSSVDSPETQQVKAQLRVIFATGIMLASRHGIDVEDVMLAFDEVLDEITEVTNVEG